jgi:predicted nucleic acid-binding protein
MAESPVLADSSYYIGLLRQGVDPLRTLAVAAATRDLAICSIVRCEVARGIVAPGVLKKFHNFWDVMINVPTDNRLWEEVERLVWRLDRQGDVLPLTDIVIACCAMRINAVVLTHDRHFGMIPGVRVVNRLDT